MADSLFQSLSNAISGLGGAFGLGSSNSNPSYLTTITGSVPKSFQTENWYKIPTSGLYQFSVESVNTTEAGNNPIDQFIKSVTSLFGDNGEFTPFDLPITPQEIVQTEQFAVSIRPTQGGTVVNHNGNKYKTLTISGTTGVAPFRGTNGMDANTGVAFGQPDDLKYRSGYEVFLHFRAWIKSYHEAKSQGGKRNELRMIFRNFKDWEFLYVEPQTFTMRRDATKPLLYYYTIQFRVLGHVSLPTPVFPFLATISDVLDHASKLLDTGRDLARKAERLIVSTAGEGIAVLNSVRKLILAVKAVQNTKLTLNDINTPIIQNFLSQRNAIELALNLSKQGRTLSNGHKDAAKTVTAITNPFGVLGLCDSLESAAKNATVNKIDMHSKCIDAIKQLGNVVASMGLDVLPAKAQQAVFAEQLAEVRALSRHSITNLQAAVDDLRTKLTNAFGVGDDFYNATFGITNTSTVSITSETTDDQFEALYALNQISTGISTLLSSDVLFDTAKAIFGQQDSANGADTLGQGVFSFPAENIGTKSGIVPQGATLEDIALAELGDTRRWTELAELNHLKAPFIVDDQATSAAITYEVRNAAYIEPTDILDLSINNSYIVPNDPTPTGAWAGKANRIATYIGGDASDTAAWVFAFPGEAVVAHVLDNDTYLQYNTTADDWLEFDVDALSSDSVLRPGDTILIPSEAAPNAQNQSQGPRDNRFTNALPNAQKALGVDLKLTTGGDLDLMPSGDLAVVYGYDNGAQAVILKLLYAKGSLKKFPTIGTNLGIGRKLQSISELRQSIYSSLIQDARIEDVQRINILRQNNSVNVTFDVKFKAVSDIVPINIPI